MAFRTNKMPVLQEKSASGAVASFNTALAMPLASCNIAVNAWQEGSGDPSPVNNRPIHGFSEVNVTRAGKNLIINSDDEFTLSHPNFHTYNLGVTVKTNTQITISFNCEMPSDLRLNIYNSSGTVNLANSPVGRNTVTFVASRDISAFRLYVFNADNLAFSEAQLEIGSTPTAYEPYVTPTIYTKQLGETVYGGSYNINGDKRKTLLGKIYNGSENWQSNYSNGVYLTLTDEEKLLYNHVVMCNEYKPLSTFSTIEDLSVKINSGRTNLLVKDPEHLSVDSFISFLIDNPMLVIYEITEPIESNIGATPISPIIGNNTIFADTGDIDLTYKDLDIAKRGNFREVFKLPS